MARLYGPGPEPPPPLIATADLSGLSASDVDDHPVGELVGTLSEERTGLIRYLDVAVRSDGRHVLVPIGHARIDRESVPPRVRLRAATQQDLLSIPTFVEEVTTVDGGYQEKVLAAHGLLFYGSRYYAHPAYDHSALTAGTSPIIVPDRDRTPDAPRALWPLAELDGFRIARSAPELVGWTVRDPDGETVGEIADLLVEPAARQARYAVVRLPEFGRSTAIPIGYLQSDEEAGEARLRTLTRADVRILPAFESRLTRDEENRIHAAIEGRLTGERYFDRPDFRSGRHRSGSR